MSQAILIENVRVFDPGGKHHDKSVDILVQGGAVSFNPGAVQADAIRIKQPGLCVSHGWVDVGAQFCEPGLEHRETIRSLQRAALAGGYTHILAQPATDPPVADRSAVKAAKARTEGHPVTVSLIAALSKDNQNEQLAELADMRKEGVQYFGDAYHSIDDAKLLQLGLAYADQIGAAVITRPDLHRLSADGQMHEGVTSTKLGMRGIPAIAEEIGLDRDLGIQRYQGGRLHFSTLTLASTVATIDELKQVERQVTYGIPVLNLLLCDSDLASYDVNLKVNPPLREKQDREALRQSILAGKADVLASNHEPYDMDAKRVEFPYAELGAATLEISYALARTAIDDSDAVVTYLARKNRQFVGLDCLPLDTEVHQSLTLYLPEEEFKVGAKATGSKATNIPLVDKMLKGKPFAVIIGGELQYCDPNQNLK